MGQRSRTETVAAVMVAMTQRRVWKQAELAREVDVQPEALRKVLNEMVSSGFRLDRDEDHPHVYWSVPKDWFPGAVLFKREDVPELVRQLRRLPRGKVRERLLGLVVEQLPARAELAPDAPIVARAASDSEQDHTAIVEDAAARKIALSMRYLTASRGNKSEHSRHVSVHLVDIGPPARFIATCHRNGDLRWFRVEGILQARLDEREPFRECSAETLADFRSASLDGYKGVGAPVSCSFFVREPESSWVANNLIEGMRVDSAAGSIRVTVETSAVERLARYVVALGGAARPENQALAEAVAELARGALQQARQAGQPSDSRTSREAARRGTAQPLSDG
jgi:predicted DNA-binding transcriptional regulator YafY